GALSVAVPSMEYPSPVRLVPALSFACFPRAVGTAMALEWGFCGFAHCGFLSCQTPLARRSNGLGLLRGVADSCQRHCHLRSSARRGSLQLSTVPWLGGSARISAILLLETLAQRPHECQNFGGNAISGRAALGW